MARLNWTKNEQVRRRQRFGSEPVGQIDVSPPSPLVPYRSKHGSKKTRNSKRRLPATSTKPEAPPRTPIAPATPNAPGAYEQSRQELAHIDQEILRLENALLRQRRRRVKVMSALKRMAQPGKALHAEKLIPAAEVVSRPMRRKKNLSTLQSGRNRKGA